MFPAADDANEVVPETLSLIQGVHSQRPTSYSVSLALAYVVDIKFLNCH